MRTLLLSAVICALISSVAFADRMISSEDAFAVAEAVRSGQCEQECTVGAVRAEQVNLPADLGAGKNKGYRIVAPGCGSGGCPSAIVAIGEAQVHYLGDGLTVSVQAAHIRPVSDATRLVDPASEDGLQNDTAAERTSFVETYPETNAVVEDLLAGKPLVRQAVEEAADAAIGAIRSRAVTEGFLGRSGISAETWLDDLLGDPTFFRETLGPNMHNVAKDAALDIVVGVAIDLLAVHAAERFMDRVGPQTSDSQVYDIAETVLAASLREGIHAGLTLSNPAKLKSDLFRRVWDIWDIAVATEGLLQARDRTMLATLAGIDSSADLFARDHSAKSNAIAVDVYMELRELGTGVFGADDADAIGKLLDLTRAALINHYSGNPESAYALRQRILELGRTGGNIGPLSAIRGLGDYVTALRHWGKDAPERVAQMAMQITPLGTLTAPSPPAAVAGALCASSRAPMAGEDLKDLLWGARMDGINRAGKRWSEYLARDQITIFVNAEGREVLGKYRLKNDQICFGYGTADATSCKRVARCLSDEGTYVILDLAGNQTSVITEVEMHAGSEYHHRRRAALLQTQDFTAPLPDMGPRRYTAIPAYLSDDIQRLQRLLTDQTRRALIDRQACTMTLRMTEEIRAQVVAAGGWSDWMGDTQGGTKVVGQTTREFRYELERINPDRSDVSGAGLVTVRAATGMAFRVDDTTRRTDDPSKNRNVTSFHRLLNIPTRNDAEAREVALRLSTLVRACQGTVATPAVAAVPPSDGSRQLPGSYQRPEFLSGSQMTDGLRTCVRRGDLAPVVVNHDSIEFYDTSCTLEPPLGTSNSAYSGTAACNSEGTLYRGPIALNVSGNMLTLLQDGTRSTLERCADPNASETPELLATVVATPLAERVGSPSVADCAQIEEDSIRLECFDAAFRAGASRTDPEERVVSRNVPPQPAVPHELDRAMAADLIQRHEKFDVREVIALHANGFDFAKQMRMFEMVPMSSWEINIYPAYRDVIVSGQRAAFGGLGGYLRLTRQGTAGVEVDLTVDGIVGGAEERSAVVEFGWAYTALPSGIREIAVGGGKGRAQLVLYDDGWRIVELTVGRDPRPF